MSFFLFGKGQAVLPHTSSFPGNILLCQECRHCQESEQCRQYQQRQQCRFDQSHTPRALTSNAGTAATRTTEKAADICRQEARSCTSNSNNKELSEKKDSCREPSKKRFSRVHQLQFLWRKPLVACPGKNVLSADHRAEAEDGKVCGPKLGPKVTPAA